ncbi:hypothetical protein HDR66_00880 [bacterium]|nr:hypothetical protein [bacterium]
MNLRFYAFLCAMTLPFAAHAANEGVPSYYQSTPSQNANQIGYNQYSQQGYSKYVGQNGQSQVIGTRTTTYQVPRMPEITTSYGAMTTNGIALPVQNERRTTLYAGYSRRFADFEFETGVGSILEWDDMIFNEINLGAQHNFSVRDFDMFIYGQYSFGKLSHGGLSMDYDLKPFDPTYPNEGIFTISMGDQTGKTNHIKFGLGARHVWDIAGWKLSPSIGYEIFKHDLKMSDHYYPNPAVYLPLMTDKGDYVYGDANQNYYAFPIDADVPEGLYQVCMSPEDILLVQANQAAGSNGLVLSNLNTGEYDPIMGTIPWGVDSGECVIIGGDGPIVVPGVTHIYNTTWSGFYVGLEIEKQMTMSDKLRFYVQFGLPKYSSEGIWPNRDDWQQNPSFTDEGSKDSYSYTAEMEYNLRLSDRLQLALKADMNVFHVGRIPGKLYIAEYTDIAIDENGNAIFETITGADGGQYLVPVLETIPASTEHVSNSLTKATWQSFGLHLGLKYAF